MHHSVLLSHQRVSPSHHRNCQQKAINHPSLALSKTEPLPLDIMAQPHTNKSKGRQGDASKQATRSNSWKPLTDSTDNARVNSHGNQEMPAMANLQPWKLKGRRGNKSKQATGPKPQQSTTHSINHRKVNTRHNNSETPGQSGSSNAKGDNGQSVQSAKVNDTSDTPGFGFMSDQGLVQQISFDTQAGNNYPLPGTIVDLSRPASDFFQEVELPEMQRPASYKSLLDMASTVSIILLTNLREQALTLSSHRLSASACPTDACSTTGANGSLWVRKTPNLCTRWYTGAISFDHFPKFTETVLQPSI